MTTHMFNADGKLTSREVPGPSSYEDWAQAWDFATSGFLHAGLASRGACEDDAEAFHSHARVYPRYWWLAANAEWSYRFEVAPSVMTRLQDFHRHSPALSIYNPDRPWTWFL